MTLILQLAIKIHEVIRLRGFLHFGTLLFAFPPFHLEIVKISVAPIILAGATSVIISAKEVRTSRE